MKQYLISNNELIRLKINKIFYKLLNLIKLHHGFYFS